MFPDRTKTYFRFYDEKMGKKREELATAEQYEVLGKIFDIFITEEETVEELGKAYEEKIRIEQNNSVVG
jgi:hypothetical protein